MTESFTSLAEIPAYWLTTTRYKLAYCIESTIYLAPIYLISNYLVSMSNKRSQNKINSGNKVNKKQNVAGEQSTILATYPADSELTTTSLTVTENLNTATPRIHPSPSAIVTLVFSISPSAPSVNLESVTPAAPGRGAVVGAEAA